MDSIVKWISQNPYWAVAGLIATFLALIIAIVTPILQRRRKCLSFSYSTTQLVESDVSYINGIKILYHDTPINQLSVSSMLIENSGNTLICASDFYKNHELRLTLHENVSILGIDLIKQSDDTIECKADCSTEEVVISFQSLEKKEYISFNLYHTGDAKTAITPSGKIREGKITIKDANKRSHFIISFICGVLSSLLGMLLSLLFNWFG